ncbi:hypothetical protein ACFCVQ_25945 [Bacillus thuringiensis]|nr:hypothetical protein [Bacillus wiedmannii]
MANVGVKPIEGMRVQFENVKEMDRFVDWVNGNSKDSEALSAVKEKFSNFLKKKRG